MEFVYDALFLAALVLIVEKAVLFHAKTYIFIALHGELRDPPLFRPLWRLAIYVAYVIGGLFALRAPIARPVAIAVIVVPIFLLVSLDLLALRRARLRLEDFPTGASD